MKNSIYPELVNQMKLKNEKCIDLAKLIGLDVSQVSRKLTGYIDWKTKDIEILCNHYNMDFRKLFRKEM